jgi:hypothetical protein
MAVVYQSGQRGERHCRSIAMPSPCIAHELRNMPCNSRLQGNPENNNPENNNKVSNWA